MWVQAIYIAYLKNNIEHKKIKTRLELITLSLSVVIIALEISLISSMTMTQEIATTMTKLQYYYSWGLLTRSSVILIVLVSQYLPDEIILFYSRPIGLLVRNF